MKSGERQKVLEFRTKYQLGYGEIAKRVKVSKSTLSRWLKDMPLSEKRILELRRNAWSKGEAKREQFRLTMRLKKAERHKRIYEQQLALLGNLSDRDLYIAGLMLYAAEGDKRTEAEIAFANTDWVMTRFFADWLAQFLCISREKLKIQLHLYENMNVKKEERFWMRELGFSKVQLVKSQVRPLRGAYSYQEPDRHGTCKLYVGGVEKKAELMLSIKAFFAIQSRRKR